MFFSLQLSASATQSLMLAQAIAVAEQSRDIGTEHILAGITAVKSCPAAKIIGKYAQGEYEVNVPETMLSSGGGIDVSSLSPRSKNLLAIANEFMVANGQSAINTEHLALAILTQKDSYGYKMLSELCGANLPSVEAELKKALGGSPERQGAGGYKQLPDNLLQLGIDLTDRARNGKMDPVIGRGKEIERIIQILCRKTKNNPVLIGEPGVGKSAVIEGLAQEIVKGNVPELLKDKTIFSLDIGSLMAGTKYRGAMEEKLKNAIDTIIDNKNIIVFIDELHTLANAGSDKGEVKPADMLKPYLARGEMQTIGATTTDEYRKFIEEDKALERRFQPITVDPPTVEQTIEILKGLRDNYEAFHKISITDSAIFAAATLSDRYIMDRFLPDKAIDLIDEAASRVKVSGNTVPSEIKEVEAEYAKVCAEKDEAVRCSEYSKAEELHQKQRQLEDKLNQIKTNWKNAQAKHKSKIDAEDIAEIVAGWTKIPVTKINETEKDKLLKLESILHKRVIGQDDAIISVSKAIRRARAGLKSHNKPIGSFIFLGPTGVGKTELCKAIAEAMFDDENFIIRLDMSEYMESHSVSKLIGSPPGYVGYDEGGQLTEQVRHKPYSVLLFDEIEKAHPEIFNLLLQILDEGRLTDSRGRVVSFKNTIVIMTSNVGVQQLKDMPKALGFSDLSEGLRDKEKNSEILTNALKKKFKPEFLNRVDVISIFEPLSKEQIEIIAKKMLDGVNKKLKEKNIIITFRPEVVAYLVEKGYDPEYGARPLRRVVEQKVEDTLAECLLDGTVKENSEIVCYVEDGEIHFGEK